VTFFRADVITTLIDPLVDGKMKHLVLASPLVLILSMVECSSCRADGAPSLTNAIPSTVVFVANGSGDQDYVSDAMCSLVRNNHLPLCIRRVAWSRTGFGTLDLHDKAGQKLAAQRLAASVLLERSTSPQIPICLVGHSAGAHVVLAAAEQLPAGTLERIVLLAPAVSRHYDLRPALRATCKGIDSYYSKTDCILMVVETVCLTADGHKAITAGRVGFAPACFDDPLFRKLRQYPYAPCMKQLEHGGGHYGWTRPPFLLSFVVPLLTCPESGER
jgi:pimeloyl-ACP methyl ester carboxylesterase